jgi:hypothetical protein
MVSVHRSPDLLDRELASAQAHAVIAGAGLAAHLPGIVAAKVLVPVLGIPCSAAIGGVDSLFAIQQMPFGIPVLTTAPDQYSSAVDFVTRLGKLDLQYSFDGFNLVLDRHKRSQPHFQILLERANRISEKTKIELNLTDKCIENAVNICLVDINESDPESPLPFAPAPKDSDEVRVLVPVLNEKSYRDPYAAIAVARRINSASGQVWTGINNVGNALLAALQFANADGAHSAFLTNAKKGYIHA